MAGRTKPARRRRAVVNAAAPVRTIWSNVDFTPEEQAQLSLPIHLALSTPRQMEHALREVMRRMQLGQYHRIEEIAA